MAKYSFLRVANCLMLIVVGAVIAYDVISNQKWLRKETKAADDADTHRDKRSVDNDLDGDDTEGTIRGGAIYIRWGRTDCRENSRTHLVYSGVVGGSDHQNTGGGSNHLCLPLDPDWNNFNDARGGLAYIYGAEYQMPAVTSNFPYLAHNVVKLHDNNVPCAVCMAKNRFTHMMVPAKRVCPQGWYLEYQGYLTAEHFGHKGRTQFTCLDEAPEADEAGYRDENGDLFYTVEGICGSLPCPPYVDGRELTCAVCTK